MVGLIAKRTVQSVVTFFAFFTLTFFIIQAQPGDFTSQFALDPNVSPEDREIIQASFGLDKPVWQQYFIYVGNFMRGDLGVSFFHRRPVVDVILERLPRTLMLFLSSTIIAFYLGFVVGKLIAWKRGSLIEHTATVTGVYLYTIYTPWLALTLLWLFAFQLDWFPLGKFISPELWRDAPLSTNTVFNLMIAGLTAVGVMGIGAHFIATRLRSRYRFSITTGAVVTTAIALLAVGLVTGYIEYILDITGHLILPILTLTLISFAGTMLLTRNSMLETIREDYVLAARARGLPKKTLRDKYVARNAILPVVTSLVLSLALAIDGGVITEGIFSWPGLGLTLLGAAASEDIPLAVGTFLFIGILALVAHIVADGFSHFLDPRLRSQ